MTKTLAQFIAEMSNGERSEVKIHASEILDDIPENWMDDPLEHTEPVRSKELYEWLTAEVKRDQLTRDVDETIRARAECDPEFRNALAEEEAYEQAFAEIESLWHAVPGTPEHDRLQDLGKMVSRYEEKRWPIE